MEKDQRLEVQASNWKSFLDGKSLIRKEKLNFFKQNYEQTLTRIIGRLIASQPVTIAVIALSAIRRAKKRAMFTFPDCRSPGRVVIRKGECQN